MKIGKSTINFNKNASRGIPITMSIADIPYWRLYSRKKDCIQMETGKQWRSDKPLTYDQIVIYLENFNGHRVLDAYPRLSTKMYTDYHYFYDGKYFGIMNNNDGEVLFLIDASNAEIHYCAADRKSQTWQLKRKFFRRTKDKSIVYSYMAFDLLYNNSKI